jgi:1,4-alpha-glucan branching enzyme
MPAKHEFDRIIHSSHADPFSILGAHKIQSDTESAIVIRAFLPEASEVSVVDLSRPQQFPMKRIHKDGLFEVIVEDKSDIFPYHLNKTDHEGHHTEFVDPYSFLPVLTDFDLHLIGEGTNYTQHERLGAHKMSIGAVKGVFFAVWAPNALRVSVVGDFNDWDGRRHMMRIRGTSGIWELFIPDLGQGTTYKFEVKSRFKGYLAQKSDPYAFYSELRPNSASVVWDLNKYQWGDIEWMKARAETNWFEEPISIYEVHLGSWKRIHEEGNRWLTYRELAQTLVPYVKGLGFTHVELLPVSEHPLDESWGYQTVGYFSVTSRHGTPDDFMYLVDAFHQAGIGVILDWVPAHFPKDGHGLAFFDGTALYEHENPLKGEHKDWGTLIFNYGRNEVAGFLISNGLFWLDKYHIDGLRVDAVASMLYLDYSRKPGEWIPNEFGGNENLEAVAFIKRFNETVHRYNQGVLTIAEESTAWPAVSHPTYLGGLGFSMKWNMGWMNDILSYFSQDPLFRRYRHNNLTFALLYAFTENFILVLSHDEVVHGKRSLLDKMPGDSWQKFANLRLLYTYMFAQPGKKLLFMGAEFGQWWEWDSNASLSWSLTEHEPHRKLQTFTADLNNIYRGENPIHEVDFSYEGFQWIDFSDYEGSIVAFMRKAKESSDLLVFVFNFTPVPRFGYRIGVPKMAFYRELLNSDSEIYGGSNLGNGGGSQAEITSWHGQPCSVVLTLPPLSGLILKPIVDIE